MKNKLLLLLIIINIILILLLLHFNSNTEHFDYYKSNTIQLTLQSHKPLTISTGNENINYSILANIISNLYPMEILYHDNSSSQNIINVINKECELGICHLDSLNNAFMGNEYFNYDNSNLRYVCSLYTESITLICHVPVPGNLNLNNNINSWLDIKNKTICVGEMYSSSYFNFIKILTILGIEENELTIITKNIFDPNIINQFVKLNIYIQYN